MGGWRVDRRSFIGLAAAALSASPARAQPAVVAQAHDSRFDPWIEVKTDHLLHNAAEVARLAGGRPILAVIKNNGYGIGLLHAARALTRATGVDGFAVVKLHEAIDLREAGITKPILLMGPFDTGDVADLHAHDIMPMVYTPIGDALARAAQGAGRPISIHLKIDTGLGRIGVPVREAEALARDLAARKGVTIAGLMMTFSEDPVFDREQLRRFEALGSALKQSGVNVGRLHATSSYTFFQHQDVLLDMVRPGMVLYGVFPEARFRKARVIDLRPAVAFKTRVIYTKRLIAGESAGYERAFVAKNDTWIATLPVGHADGWPRAAAKGARVRIGARLYPVIASVSASHTLVDIGRDPAVHAGDVATLFDWEDGSRPEDVAASCGASVYDLLMHLGGHLSRRAV